MPTYPLDRRVLQLIVDRAGSTIDLDNVTLTRTKEYERISNEIIEVYYARKKQEITFHYQTLKRAFGHTKTKKDSGADKRILEAIACYLGYDGWNQLVIDDRRNSVNSTEDELQYVKTGDHVTVRWRKDGLDAEVRLECLVPDKYRVTSAKNISLQYGDTLKGVDCRKGFLFRAQDLIRDGSPTQRYDGKSGVLEIIIEKKAR
jgi:hypothetical protein